jgi:hypothetical protein
MLCPCCRNQNASFLRMYNEDPEDLDVVVAEPGMKGKTRQSRPPRSVLYYLKGYESSITLTPVQLPPRSRILQVHTVSATNWPKTMCL